MALHTILAVEDDPLMRHMLRDILQNHDFLVLEAVTNKRLRDILAQQKVDLILLDLNLADGSSLESIADIRVYSNVPIVVLSGAESKESRLRSLDAGADDYIQKPFDADELVARIQTHIRRHKGAYGTDDSSGENSGKDSFSGWVLDEDQRLVSNKDNIVVNLTTKEFQLLQRLVTEGSRVVTRQDLCEAIREKNYIPTPRAIDIKITRLRKKIGDDATAPQIIKTVRGIGYVLDCEKIQQKGSKR